VTDRRAEKRYPISIPVSGWGAVTGSFAGHTRDVSGRGIYILSDVGVKQDDQFVLLMSFPQLLVGQRATLVWADCHAVRVERAGRFANGAVGIAAIVDEYVLPVAPWCMDAAALKAAA
jgi:PilZ domain